MGKLLQIGWGADGGGGGPAWTLDKATADVAVKGISAQPTSRRVYLQHTTSCQLLKGLH